MDATRQLPKAFPQIDLKTPEGWRICQLLKLLNEELKNSLAPETHWRKSLADTPLAAANG